MVKAHLLTCLLFLACACGGKSNQGAPGAVGAAGAPAVEPTCAETPRSADDERANAALVDMATHAQSDKLVPVLISLVDVPITAGAMEAARSAELEPYQAPIVGQLTEWGAQSIERFWLINAVAASVPASHIEDLLCLPNVVRLDSDAAYWDIVEPPWGPEQAGKLECPVTGEQCPEHCFDFNGVPFDASAGCYRGTERVACSTTRAAIDDGAASCFQNIASGKTYLFYSFVPIDPNFIGWRPCENQPAPKICAP